MTRALAGIARAILSILPRGIPTRALASLAIVLAVFTALGSSSGRAQGAPPRGVTIGYLEIDGDPRYEPLVAYLRMVLQAPQRPFAGAEVAIREAETLERISKAHLVLERMTAPSETALVATMLRARERGVELFLVDAPASALAALAAAAHKLTSEGRDVLLFNVSAGEDELRRRVCAAEIIHTIPSLAMRMDALVQYLVSRKWRDLLVLEGPDPADAVLTAAFLASARKLGARIVAHQKFVLGSDPRERERNNPALLTAVNRDYDVAFVADASMELARQLPYRMSRARPVVGSIDLEPEAWHWTFERHGAPQLNQRFTTGTGGRHMASADWAAWVAVKMIANVLAQQPGADLGHLKSGLIAASGFDGAKGLAVSVRPWDHQLRQPIMLTTPLSVIATAPVEGFLHQTNTLDTLGDDAPETPCRLDR